jgi:hypothetical protein
MAEPNNELLIKKLSKNYQLYSTGSKPFPEMNEIFVQKTRKN